MPQEQEPGSAEDDGTRSPFRVASIGDLFSFSLASSRHAPSLHVLNEAAEKDGARGQCNKNRSLCPCVSQQSRTGSARHALCKQTCDAQLVRYAALNAADSLSPRKASGIESNELPSDFKHLSRDLKSGHTLAAFVVISASYMLCTFTDGSLRMIVLLAGYNKDFTAMEVLPSPLPEYMYA